MTKFIISIALLLASLGWNAYQWRQCAVEKAKAIEQANTRAAEATAAAQESARKVESAQAKAANDIAESYEQGKRDAQAIADRTLADQRTGDIRLRNIWQGAATRCMSNLDNATGQLDAARRDREESAARIVRSAAEADRQIAALQAFIRAERNG